MILIPDDYFEPEPQARSASLDEIRIVQQNVKSTLAPDRTIRISTGDTCRSNPNHEHKAGECCSSFSRAFHTINLATGEKHDINCRSYRCERHKGKWAARYGAILSDNISRNPVSLLVNLTTPQWLRHSEFSRALQLFIRYFRADFGKTEYVKIMEENKKHNLPHAHLLFCCEDLKIPEMTQEFIKKCKKRKKKLSWPFNIFSKIKEYWTRAIKSARPGIKIRTKDGTAIVWCQPPQGKGERAAQYALGYITGQNQKGKNEEVSHRWRGRKITYSKGFFDKPTKIIWQELLTKWFGSREIADYGLVFNPDCPKEMRIKWLEKHSVSRSKREVDFDTGEISIVVQNQNDPRYLLQLGMIYEGHNRPVGPKKEPDPLYFYDYLSKDKLFEVET
jgi:hypothetical protein